MQRVTACVSVLKYLFHTTCRKCRVPRQEQASIYACMRAWHRTGRDNPVLYLHALARMQLRLAFSASERKKRDRTEHNGPKTGKRYAHFPKNGPSMVRERKNTAICATQDARKKDSKREREPRPLARFPWNSSSVERTKEARLVHSTASRQQENKPRSIAPRQTKSW